MPLSTIVNGQLSDASQLDQVINTLQQQAGATESRNYFLFGSSYTNGATISISQSFLSSVTTPVSASLNTAIQTPTGIASLTTAHLSASGMQIWAISTGTGVNVGAAGAYTVQF
jgi:hypothetical protein